MLEQIKNGFAKFAVVGLLMVPQWVYAHGDGEGPVSIELETASVQAGKTTLSFQLVDNVKNKVIVESELSVSHEKKLHMLIYDPSLGQFQHVHPEFKANSNGLWQVEVSFSVNGNYWVWAQGVTTSDGNEFSANSRLNVTGGSAALPAPPVFTDIRKGEDRGSFVEFAKVPLKAGVSAQVGMSFSRKDGSKPQITPYLGAIAHVVSTPTDGDSLIHVHPMDHGGTAMIHVEFPEAGFYRLWVQFIDGGILRTVPLSVEVRK